MELWLIEGQPIGREKGGRAQWKWKADCAFYKPLRVVEIEKAQEAFFIEKA